MEIEHGMGFSVPTFKGADDHGTVFILGPHPCPSDLWRGPLARARRGKGSLSGDDWRALDVVSVNISRKAQTEHCPGRSRAAS